MGFRQIYIKLAKELRLKNNNLKIVKVDNSEIILPLEDISSILLEDPKTIITARLLTELAKSSISLTLCDEKYFPTAQVLPWNTYYNQVGILKSQMNATQTFKDNLWKKIIKQKIINQKKVIELTTNDDKTIELLEGYSHGVKIGDKDNREAISARIFFNNLYGNEFVRFGSSAVNSALNYGYSILHGSIVRQLACNGLNTCIGIWHKSEQNAYNLASDLIESFRPIVDYYIFWHQDHLDDPLPIETRKGLIELLNENVLINSKVCKVEYAIGVCCQSYVNCLEKSDASLLRLPEIVEVDFFGKEGI